MIFTDSLKKKFTRVFHFRKTPQHVGVQAKGFSLSWPGMDSNSIKSSHMVHSYGTRHRHIKLSCIHLRSSRLGRYSLSFQGPKIWNSIDKKTIDIKLIFSFKKCIKLKILSKQGNNSGREPSDLAFEWNRGWSLLCFDTNSCFPYVHVNAN